MHVTHTHTVTDTDTHSHDGKRAPHLRLIDIHMAIDLWGRQDKKDVQSTVQSTSKQAAHTRQLSLTHSNTGRVPGDNTMTCCTELGKWCVRKLVGANGELANVANGHSTRRKRRRQRLQFGII